MSDKEWADLPSEVQKQYCLVKDRFATEKAALDWITENLWKSPIKSRGGQPFHTPERRGRAATGGS
jgi:hypothetical protein